MVLINLSLEVLPAIPPYATPPAPLHDRVLVLQHLRPVHEVPQPPHLANHLLDKHRILADSADQPLRRGEQVPDPLDNLFLERGELVRRDEGQRRSAGLGGAAFARQTVHFAGVLSALELGHEVGPPGRVGRFSLGDQFADSEEQVS